MEPDFRAKPVDECDLSPPGLAGELGASRLVPDQPAAPARAACQKPLFVQREDGFRGSPFSPTKYADVLSERGPESGERFSVRAMGVWQAALAGAAGWARVTDSFDIPTKRESDGATPR